MSASLDEVCRDCNLCVEQPESWEHQTVDGVFIKSMDVRQANIIIPQHAHRYDHTTMVARGSVRVWIEDELLGDFAAPAPIFIKRRAMHTFLTLEANTLLYCIHNSSRLGSIEVVAEHQLAAHG